MPLTEPEAAGEGPVWRSFYLYVVAALSYLVNQNKSDDDRSLALDIVIFFAAVIFTVTPFFLALKYRKHEDAFINKGRVNKGQVDVEQNVP